jgi:predicted phosphodiesterase
MRILVLTDVHANFTALQAALSSAEGLWERVVCLGDVVGYGPDPNEVVDRLRALDAITIRGNHDKASCGLEDPTDFNPVARTAAMWTREQLTPENSEYLRRLPVGPVEVEGLTLVHGAFRDEDEYVFSPAQALEGLLESPAPITFFGHTHMQGGFCLRDNRVEALHFKPRAGELYASLRIESGSQYLLNPGSIGQPRDGDPRAAFAIADPQHGEVQFWRVPYDIASVQERMKRAGLPEPLILRLAVGR